MIRRVVIAGSVLALLQTPLAPAAPSEPGESRFEEPEVEDSRLEKEARAAAVEEGVPLPAPMAPATGAELFLTIPAEGFQLRTAGADQYMGNSRYCTQNVCEWVAPVQVPHGARIVGIELEACDTQQFVSVYLIVRAVLGLEAGSVKVADVFSSLTSQPSTPGCHYFLQAPVAPFVVDQFLHSLAAAISIGKSDCNISAPHECPSSGTRFRAARIYYEPGNGVVEPGSTSPVSVFP